MALLPDTQVKFTAWDAIHRTPDEISVCSYLTPLKGKILRQTKEHVFVIEWFKAQFKLGSEVASGNLISEHWDSEIEELAKDEYENSNADSSSDSGNGQGEKDGEGDSGDEIDREFREFTKKYDPEKEKERVAGQKLEVPEDYGNEVTGPIVLTNHPEKWQKYELPDGTKFKWNGEIWVDIDENEVPKDAEERETYFDDNPEEEEKFGNNYDDSKVKPVDNITLSQTDQEKQEKWDFVKSRGFTLNADKKSFTSRNGAIYTGAEVGVQYEQYRVQKVLYERLRIVIAESWLDGLLAKNMIDIYKQFRDRDSWSKKQTRYVGNVVNKYRAQIKAKQGDAYREIKKADPEWLNHNCLD